MNRKFAELISGLLGAFCIFTSREEVFMSWIISSLIFLVVTAVSLLIIAQLPLGIEVDSFGKAFISALIFGVLTASLRLFYFC